MFMPKLRTGTAPSYSACGWSQQVARLQSGAKKETLTSAWEEVQGGIAKGHNTKGHCHPRASSAKTRGFHTQLDEGPETP